MFTMKKLFLFSAFIMAMSFAQAQDYSRDSLLMRIVGADGNTDVVFNFPTFVEMRDGTLLMELPLRSQAENRCIGDWFYKISPQNNSVLDSVFVETDNVFIEDDPLSLLGQNVDKDFRYRYDKGSRSLLAQNPGGNDYIFAKLVYSHVTCAGDKGNTWLRISQFDENLSFQNHNDALMVHLEDTIVERLCSIMLDDDNIILMYLLYGKWNSPIIARVGLDGTLKEKTVFPNLLGNNTSIRGSRTMGVFNNSPREYALFEMVGGPEPFIKYHVIDSLLNYKESIVMENHYGDVYQPYPDIQYTENYPQLDIMLLDDGTFLEVRQYERHNITRNGACIMKYDKTTYECLGNALFESQPIYSNSAMYGYPIGLKKATDGNLYFAYRTNANSSISRGWIGIAKLDTNLNIIWQRYCFGSWYSTIGYLHTYCRMSLTKDGFLIGGNVQMDEEPYNFFLYFVHDDGTIGTPEAEAIVRPYLFYPNPAQTELHLQYSPDVKPTKIELYDLQGRLVRTQSKGLESLNLQGLVAGAYTMRVVLDNGKVFSDKVIKE